MRAVNSSVSCVPSLSLAGWGFQGARRLLWSFFPQQCAQHPGERSRGTGLMWLYCWWERGRKLTGWHTRLGLQLSPQEDSCEAAADMLGRTGAELHESICPVKMPVSASVSKFTTKPRRGRVDWNDLKSKTLGWIRWAIKLQEKPMIWGRARKNPSICN